MRNMSVWGPGTKAVLRRREFDAYIFPETHADTEESNNILVDANKAGNRAVVSPARPSARRKKAGGLMICADKRFASTSYMHMAARESQQCGFKSFGLPAARGGSIDFHDFAALRVRAKRLAITVGGVYLDAGVGLNGVNLQKFAAIGAFLQAASDLWVLAGDWNVSDKDLAQSLWLQKVGGHIVTPNGAENTSLGGKGQMYDYAVVSQKARAFLHEVVLDDSADSKAHDGIIVFFRFCPDAALEYKLLLPKPFAQAARPKKEANKNSKRTRQKALVKKWPALAKQTRSVKRPFLQKRLRFKGPPPLAYLDPEEDLGDESDPTTESDE